MTQVQQMAALVQRAAFGELSDSAKHHLKMHILDTLGCALAVLGEGPIAAMRAQVDEFGGRGPCTLIGGGKASPPYAAFYNTSLTRYLDFMDNYLGQSETCHPCDNFAPVLAAVEYAGGSGRDLMTALALAYQVQCRMTGAAPIMQRGFDHTTQLSFSVAAGVSKALGMDRGADGQRHRHLRRGAQRPGGHPGRADLAVEGTGLVADGDGLCPRDVPGTAGRHGAAGHL